MDRQLTVMLLGLSIVGSMVALGAKRQENLKKARAVRTNLRAPHSNTSCYMVKVINGPSWAIGEYGTYDAETSQLLIEGEAHDAEKFEFILA
jgi:hypothetical protein